MPDGSLLIDGLKLPDARTSDALAQLHLFQLDFEALFVALAERLPVLSTSIETMTSQVTTVRGHQGSVSTVFAAEVEGMVKDSQALAGLVLSDSKAALDSAAALGTEATALSQFLADAREVSGRLRLAGLNALFAAVGLGPKGVALNAVNRSLITLAEGAGALARQMGANAAATTTAAAALGAAQQAFADRVGGVSQQLGVGGRTALTTCLDSVNRLGTELDELSTHGAEVSAATRELMLVLQRQDIVRQGTKHVVDVLRALQGARAQVDPTRDEQQKLTAFLAFQARASRLVGALMQSLSKELHDLVASVASPTQGLTSAAAHVAACVERAHELEHHLAQPAEQLVADVKRRMQLEAPLQVCEARLHALEEQLTTLRPTLEALLQVPVQVKVVALLMKVEVARTPNGAGSSVGAVAEELSTVCVSLNALHDSAERALGLAEARLGVVRLAVARQRETLMAASGSPAALKAHTERLRSVSRDFVSQLTDLDLAAQALSRSGANVAADLGAFGASMKAFARLGVAYERCADESERLLEKLGAPTTVPPEYAEELDALVNGFTLAAHQRIAAPPEAGVPDANGEPGELTLF